jgi:D-sedoheptulose 7-phosphate isomerase
LAGTICHKASEYLNQMGELCARVDANSVDRLTDWVFDAWRDEQQVLVLGNGGSASTSSHFVADLVKTAAVEGQKRLLALCMADNVGLTTALGNDIAYQKTLVYPLETYARSGDLVIAISGSGNSPNVVEACEWAISHNLRLAVLTGFSGGKIGAIGQVHINIPTDNFGLMEDLHLSVGHMISQGLKARVEAA